MKSLKKISLKFIEASAETATIQVAAEASAEKSAEAKAAVKAASNSTRESLYSQKFNRF